jgi:micrococcal nuclease
LDQQRLKEDSPKTRKVTNHFKMQVYVHRDGQNLGPYSIGQLRPYLQAGNFTGDDLACHDGTNWLALKDVPGLIGRANKQAPQARIARKEPVVKPRKKLFILLGVGILVISLVGISVYFLLKKEASLEGPSTLTAPGQLETRPERAVKTSVPDEEEELEDSKPSTTLGLLEITPEQVVEVYDGDTFKIDLQGVHPLFGDKLPIRVKGIDTPEMRGTSEEVKALAIQARELTENTLKSAQKIELRNPERGKYFRVVAEVWVDGKALAGMLKEKGLAKDYDGEGQRPSW